MKSIAIPTSRRALATLALVIASGCVHAPAAQPSPSPAGGDDVGAVMREYLRRAEAFGFSGAAAVEIDGRLAVLGGYGMADRARGIPVTDDTPFYVASVSKQFTAAAVLRLEMEGRLRTSDTLGRFFPEAPPALARITLHQLLTHTAGVGEVPIGEGPAEAEAFAREVFARAPRFAPGTDFAYSNTGYALLAAVVQRACGEAFGACLHRALFAPAGMTRTAVVTHAAALPGARDARAYRGGIDFGDALRPDRTLPWSALGGTGVVTSVADLYRWERALRDTAILSNAAKAKLFTPERDRYAYGWAVAPTRRGTTRISHDGLLFPEGWSAAFDRYADEGVVVLAVSNAFEREGLAAPVARDLGRIALGGSVALPPAPLPAAADDAALAGRYALPTGGAFEVRHEGGRLWITAEGQRAVDALQDEVADSARNDSVAARTAEVIDALRSGREDLLAPLLGPNLPPARALERWRALTAELARRHGPLAGARVLHAAREDEGGQARRSHARLRFARASVSLWFSWEEGKMTRFPDLGSFPEGIRDAEPLPAPRAMARVRGGRFATWEMASGRARFFAFGRDGEGRPALTAWTAGGPVRAVRE